MKKIFGLFLSVIFICSCSHADKDDGLTPISISSQIELNTKAELQTTQFEKEQAMSLFVTKAGTTDLIYNNQPLIADGKGGFTYGEGSLYYPAENDTKLDLYAVHPYHPSYTLNTMLDFKVSTNQADTTGFLVSDLIYGNRTNVSKVKEAIPMTFYHKMSKLMFVINGESSSGLGSLSSVQIQNVVSGVSMDVITGDIVTAIDEMVTINAYGIQNIDTNQTELTGISAFIPPQTFTHTSDKTFIKLNFGNTSMTYVPTNDLAFQSGVCYKFTITVVNTQLVVTPTIVDWENGNPTGGTPEI